MWQVLHRMVNCCCLSFRLTGILFIPLNLSLLIGLKHGAYVVAKRDWRKEERATFPSYADLCQIVF